jgi:dolichyl-diphosphooligosaccharide--protein glycosyltransferase
MLNYPLGARGGRAPLLNMMAIGFSNLLTPFMNEVDAIGLSMQFIPALFGALLIIPVYYIGKIIFNKKAGLIAAFFIAIIPIHIGSGHGSAFSLFDHDSFNLLLFFLTFLFLVLSLKEKDDTKSLLYAILAGVPLAGLSMIWVEARFLYAIIALYAIVQMIFDIFTNKIEKRVFISTSVTLVSGYLISLPVIASSVGGFSIDTPLLMAVGITFFGFLYYLFAIRRIPWTLSLPFIFVLGSAALVFIYFIEDIASSLPILSSAKKLSNIIFGSGI